MSQGAIIDSLESFQRKVNSEFLDLITELLKAFLATKKVDYLDNAIRLGEELEEGAVPELANMRELRETVRRDRENT